MSREAQSRAAKPRETKRRQPLPERAFHRAEVRLPSRQRMLPLKPGQMNDL